MYRVGISFCRVSVVRFLMIALCFLVAMRVPAYGQTASMLTPEEAAAELVKLTDKLMPFAVAYDRDSKALTFTEVVESGDKALNNRIGQLQLRLDRADIAQIKYLANVDLVPIAIKGQKLAGKIYFFCLADRRCVRRGFPDAKTGLGDREWDESEAGIAVFEGITVGDLQRYAALVQVLIAAAEAK